MKLFLYFILSIFALTGLSQQKVHFTKVTVIYYNNQNPEYRTTKDTLYKAKQIDLSATLIDIFYCSKYFHLPYYLPTDGFYKNATKYKECNMKNYPATVKCYQYDALNRVIKMTVSGSGAENSYSYKYNVNGEITEIVDSGHDKFTITYYPDKRISRVLEKSLELEKSLVFVYK